MPFPPPNQQRQSTEGIFMTDTRRVKRCIIITTTITRRQFFLPARRYASAGTSYCPVSVCVCHMSQAGVLSKRLNESGWFLAWQLPPTYPPLCYKEIRVPSTIRVLPSGTLFQTLDLEILLRRIDCRNVLSTSLEKGLSRSEHNKLGRRNISELRRLTTVVYHTDRMVKLCLQHDFVARFS